MKVTTHLLLSGVWYQQKGYGQLIIQLDISHETPLALFFVLHIRKDSLRHKL